MTKPSGLATILKEGIAHCNKLDWSRSGFTEASEVCHMPNEGFSLAQLLLWAAVAYEEMQSVLIQLSW